MEKVKDVTLVAGEALDTENSKYLTIFGRYKTEKQDGSHEPECIHVLGLRARTSAIACIVR